MNQRNVFRCFVQIGASDLTNPQAFEQLKHLYRSVKIIYCLHKFFFCIPNRNGDIPPELQSITTTKKKLKSTHQPSPSTNSVRMKEFADECIHNLQDIPKHWFSRRHHETVWLFDLLWTHNFVIFFNIYLTYEQHLPTWKSGDSILSLCAVKGSLVFIRRPIKFIPRIICHTWDNLSLFMLILIPYRNRECFRKLHTYSS